MKKFFSMALALICATTVAAFGFSACDGLDNVIDTITSSDSTGDTSTSSTDDSSGGTTDSGTTDSGTTDSGTTDSGGSGGTATKVTGAQWLTIMSVANSLLNVTVDVDYTSETTTTFTDGDVGVDNVTEEMVIKTDLAGSTTITGNLYTYSSTDYSGTWNGEDDYSYSMAMTQYEVFAADSYSFVNYSEHIQADDETYTYYDGYLQKGTLSIADSDVYSVLNYIDTIASLYAMFTYEDGVYTYSGNGMTVSVTLNGLYISAIQLELTSGSSSTEGHYSIATTENYTLTFSNYGTTEVEVPEAYTYEYYYANNIAGTEDERNIAFSVENMYNVTVNYEEVRDTENADGSTQTATVTKEVKSALTLENDQLTGNVYCYENSEYTETDDDGEWTYGGVSTDYSVYAENSYTYVNSHLSIDSGEEAATPNWFGEQYEEALALTDSSGGYFLNYIITLCTEYNDKFTYEDGVYTAEIEGGNISIIIDCGYLAEIVISTTFAYEGEFTETTVETYTFSNYGTTVVEVPEEYTYAYYIANNAADDATA